MPTDSLQEELVEDALQPVGRYETGQPIRMVRERGRLKVAYRTMLIVPFTLGCATLMVLAGKATVEQAEQLMLPVYLLVGPIIAFLFKSGEVG